MCVSIKNCEENPFTKTSETGYKITNHPELVFFFTEN